MPQAPVLVNPAFKGVKTIIFDYGGVIIDLDFGRTRAAFAQMGIDDLPALMLQPRSNDAFYQFETGHIGAEPFLNRVLQMLPPSYTADGDSVYRIVNAWNAMLGEIPTERLNLLTALKQNYTTMLLSNTNALHIAAVDAYLRKAHNVDSINPYFDKVYYSFRMGMRKPNADIYQAVLDENNLTPDETLFIDDNAQNIATAKELGLHTYHLQSPAEDVLGLFSV